MAVGFLLLFLILLTAVIAAAVWLLISGRTRREHPTCGHCGYDLTASAGNRCPECGQLFIEAGVRPPGPRGARTRTRLGIALLVAVLVLPCTMSTGMYFVARRQATAAQIAAQRAARIAVAQRSYAQSTSPAAGAAGNATTSGTDGAETDPDRP